MTNDIIGIVGKVKEKYKVSLDEIKIELGEKNFNIETILSNLEQKAIFIGKGELNTLNKGDFENLIIEIKKMSGKLLVFMKMKKTKLLRLKL